MQRRLRRSESFVAGLSATLLALALFGLAHLVQASVPFPPLGLAQRALALVPGPVAVFFVERLGHLALRAFAAGFVAGSLAIGGLAGVAVGSRPAGSRAAAAWLAAAALGLAALAGYRGQPGALSLPTYLLLCVAGAAVYATTLRGALERLARDPVPAPARGLGRTRREFLRAAAGAAGLLALAGARRARR
jgi:hypothetical protein